MRHTGFCVLCETEHDLGSAVPSCSNVLGLEAGSNIVRLIAEATGKTEVANLQLAVGIDKQVAGLEIAVQDVGRVNVLETAENLVDEGLEVGVGQGLATADDSCKITLHEFLVQVDLVVAAGAAGDVHVEKTCDLGRRQLALNRQTRIDKEERTLRWPLKCCNSLISRRARLARICLLKTLVIFLTATCSFGSWPACAALEARELVEPLAPCCSQTHTTRCRRRPGPTPL